MSCNEVQLTCTEAQKICTPFFWTQLIGSALWAQGEPRDHNDLFSSIASLTWQLLSQKVPVQMPLDVVHQAYLGKKTSGKRL